MTWILPLLLLNWHSTALAQCLNGLYLDAPAAQPALVKQTFAVQYSKDSQPPTAQFWWGARICNPKRKTRCQSLRSPKILSHAISLLDGPSAGLHLNLEKISDGDGNFLKLLESLQREKPPAKKLTIAGYFLGSRPQPGLLQWSASYWRKILPRIDGATVMLYDTALPSALAYQNFVAVQSKMFQRLAQDFRKPIQLALPVFKQGRGKLFNPKYENLTNALIGIDQAKIRCGKYLGFAIFKESEIDANEWSTIQNKWPR